MPTDYSELKAAALAAATATHPLSGNWRSKNDIFKREASPEVVLGLIARVEALEAIEKRWRLGSQWPPPRGLQSTTICEALKQCAEEIREVLENTP